jgi:site-specific DNA-methyltransferase (adenine-specific)
MNDTGEYKKNVCYGQVENPNTGRFPSNVIGEVEDYQKYFYCPKVSRKERHIGFEQKNIPGIGGGNQMAHLPGDKNSKLKAVEKASAGVGNNHPTVKPVALMRYLIKLVTPPNSIVLDPFSGSGSTGMAAVELGHEFIGCELDPAYVDIANCRIETWNDSGLPKDLFDV